MKEKKNKFKLSDGIGVIGCIMVISGTSMVSVPLALVTGGLWLTGFAIALARGGR